MQKLQYKAGEDSAAQGFGDAEFHALTTPSGKYPATVLLRALARLFVQNPAPTLWEVEQFQELMLNLLPTADAATRQDLIRLLSPFAPTPSAVLFALDETPTENGRERMTPLAVQQSAPIQPRQPVYPIAHLKELLPLQISRKMAHVAALAAHRGDRHILRSLLASQLKVSRRFADHLLTHQDGLFLATALRALRMPRELARVILLASEGLESRDLIYVPQLTGSFERLDPEACRKRLKDWERAFEARNADSIAKSTAASVQPNHVHTDFGGQTSDCRKPAAEPVEANQRRYA